LAARGEHMTGAFDGFVLRAATPADIPAITALIDASVRGLSQEHYSPAEIEESLVTVFGVDSQLIADGTYYVIERDGAVVASGGWGKRSTLYGGDQVKAAVDPLLDPATDAARIRAFYVSPLFARRGLARTLYHACELHAVAAGFRRFQLGATLPGVPLYQSLGFRALRDVPTSMRHGLTLGIVQMERDIPSIEAP
jgi:GNAT superfamily N-acetyltransferase